MRSLDGLTDRPSLLLCHGLDWEVFIYFVHCAGETYRPMQTTCDEGCITHGQEAMIYGDKGGIKLNLNLKKSQKSRAICVWVSRQLVV